MDKYKGNQVANTITGTSLDICKRRCAALSICKSFSYGNGICDLRDKDHGNYGGECDDARYDFFGDDTRYCEPDTGGFSTYRKISCSGNQQPRSCRDSNNAASIGIGSPFRADGEGNNVADYFDISVAVCKQKCAEHWTWNAVSFTYIVDTRNCHCKDKEVDKINSFDQWESYVVTNANAVLPSNDVTSAILVQDHVTLLASRGSTTRSREEALAAAKTIVDGSANPPTINYGIGSYDIKKANNVLGLGAVRVSMEQGRGCGQISNVHECCRAVGVDGYDCFPAKTTFSDGSICKSEQLLMKNSMRTEGITDIFNVNHGKEDTSMAGCWGDVGGRYLGESAYSIMDQDRDYKTIGGRDRPSSGNYEILGSHDAATGYSTTEYFSKLGVTISAFGTTARDFKIPRRCHTIDIVAQLNCGVRWFDYRPYETTSGDNYFHHAYDIVRETESTPAHTLSASLNEVTEWSDAHPTELIVLWVNTCATGNDASRFTICNKLMMGDDAKYKACSDDAKKEGSDYCYRSLADVKKAGIPVIAGCKGPTGFKPERDRYGQTNRGDYGDVLYKDWSLADYKGLAADYSDYRRSRATDVNAIRRVDRRLRDAATNEVYGHMYTTGSNPDGKYVVTQAEFNAARGGVIAVHAKCGGGSYVETFWVSWSMLYINNMFLKA